MAHERRAGIPRGGLRGRASKFRACAGRTKLFTAVATAVIGGAAIALAVWFFLGLVLPVSGKPVPRVEVVRISLLVAAGVGGAVALVVAYRRQRDIEQGRFIERFGSAAHQLAEDPAIRLAGAYAMAGVANEMSGLERQQCIDVLCGYLRLPYLPERGANHQHALIRRHPAGADRTEDERHFRFRQNDKEVRQAIVRIIARQLQPDAGTSWSDLDYNFTGAHLEIADFSEAAFRGAMVSFRGAAFSGEQTSFGGATFGGAYTGFDGAASSGKRTTFDRAMFSGEYTSFDGAAFSGEQAAFNRAEFSSAETRFVGATFSGRWTIFGQAEFGGEHTTFGQAEFSGEHTTFDHAQFRGRYTSFDGAAFSGKQARFAGAVFKGERASFYGATFSGECTSFDKAKFSEELATFDRATFRGAETRFAGATFTGGSTTFSQAEFRSAKTRFDRAAFRVERTIFDGATFSGADISFIGATFNGVLVSFQSAIFGDPAPRFDWDSDVALKPPNVEPDNWPPTTTG